MSTDDEPGVSTTADKQLQEMEKKHPQFLQSQVLKGIRLSLQLQKILHCSKMQGQNSEYGLLENIESKVIVRGFRIRPKEGPSALNGFLYSLLRSTKPQRRGVAQLLLKQFDEQSVSCIEGDWKFFIFSFEAQIIQCLQINSVEKLTR